MRSLTRSERIFVLLGVVLLIVAATAESWATPSLEEGVTFYDDGSCVEADGTLGIATLDGQCVTPADYDEIYSYENLSQQPSITQCVPGNPDCTVENYDSIAEVHGITPDDEPASERPIGEGLVEKPFTFVEHVRYVHGLPIRLA